MTNMIEGLRTSLDQATANMDEFLMSVTSLVTLNADTVLQKYQETELPLGDAITNPWETAKKAVGEYSGDALELMNTWAQNGFLTTFPETVKKGLKSPWEAGQAAAGAFKASVNTVMSGVVKTIEANVKTASSKLSELYKQIEDTEKRAASVGSGTGGSGSGDGGAEGENTGGGGGGETAAQKLEKARQAAQAYVDKAGFSEGDKARWGQDKNFLPLLQTLISAGGSINDLKGKVYKKSGKISGYSVSGLSKIAWGADDFSITIDGIKYNVKRNTAAATGDLGAQLRSSYGSSPSDGQLVMHNGALYVSLGKLWYSLKDAEDKSRATMAYYNKLNAYAKGTTGTDRDQWAITDESWIGEEITLAAGKSGRLRGMMKGSAVLPSDISENLVEWGKLNPDEMSSGNVANNYVNAPTNDVDVANSLTIDGHGGSAQDVHDSIKDTYELIEDTVRNIDSVSQHYKPSVDEALTTPWVDATEKANEFGAAANANYDNIVSHIDENKESLEIALNTPYANATGDIDDFSQHAQKASVDDVVTHANEQSPALTTALSTGFNNAKTATDAFKSSGTSAVNAVKDSFINAKTGLIKALNDTTSAANKTKQAIDNVPTDSGSSGSGASVQAGQHYISSLGKNVTLSANVTKWSSVATQALQKTGQYSYDNLLLLLHQMQTESSGNQNAINNWDINAKNGTPSKGLMQVIDPTFQAYAMKGYDKDIYDPLSNIIAAIRYTTSRYGSLSKGWRGSGYAKGTTGTSKDEWALTDEPKFGDELVLVPGKDGNLSFMRKGTGVVPADMTQKLFELAQIPTSDLMNKNLTAIVPNITKNDFKNEFNFESLVHVDTVDSDTLPKLEKMVDKKIDDFSKSLNYSLKKFTR